jgi:prepilin-type processing-associated H-X9-DG protein
MKTEKQAGFTRADLLAVIAIMGALVLVGLPAIGETGAGSDAVTCQNNQRQLVRAYHLYAADYAEYFAPTWDTSSATTPPSTWVSGTMSGTADATNFVSLITPTTSVLAPYLHTNYKVFKCPADFSMTVIAGQRFPRVRSVSINLAVGTKPLSAGGDGKKATDGAWLDGSHSHLANSVYRCYARLSDVVDPKPSGLFLFLDEGIGSINDALFGIVGPGINRGWIDWPAAYHRGGGGISYIDGHAEIHPWLGFDLLKTGSGDLPPTVAADQQWLSQRTTASISSGP